MRLQALACLCVMSCAAPPPPPPATPTTTPDPAHAVQSTAFPVTLTDQHQHAVMLTSAPQRIVSLSPALTETLFAVGCGDHVVLRDGWSDWPPAAHKIPAVEGFAPSPEAILAVHPDLVLTHFPPPALSTALEGAHLPWLGYAPQKLDDVATTIEAVGRACGQPLRGQALARAFRARVDTLRHRVAELPAPRVFYEMDAGLGGQPFTVGNQTFGHELMTQAMSTNIFAYEPRAWFQVSPEAVLDADPDAILLADADAQDHPQTLETLRHRPTMALLRAVRSGQVFGLHAGLVSRPGPRLVLGLEEVARQLHPWALLDLPVLEPLEAAP